jgi:hypothetical protein
MKVIELQIKTIDFKNKSNKLDHDSRIFFEQVDSYSTDSGWRLNILEKFFTTLSLCLDIANEINQIHVLHNQQAVDRGIDLIQQLQSNLIKSKNIEGELKLIYLKIVQSLIVELSEWLIHDFKTLKEEIADLSNKSARLTRLKIKKDLIQSKGNYLYHGLDINHAPEILARGSILGYTNQKYWENGKRYKNDDIEYNNSYRMKGISMSRDLDFSLGWGSVLLIFDKNIIQKMHAVEPFAWNNQFNYQAHSKKEREEFVILSKNKKSYKNKDNPEWFREYNDFMKDYHEMLNNSAKATNKYHEEDLKEYISYKEDLEKKLNDFNLADLRTPEGEFDFETTGALVGVVIKSSSLEIFGIDDEKMQTVLSHPKFMGILED